MSSGGAHQSDDAALARSEDRRARLETSERATAVLVAVSDALTSWDSFEDTSERLLRDLAGALGLVGAALWLPTGEALVASTIWCTHDRDRVALESALRPLRLPRGASLPGSAWERREPVRRAIPQDRDRRSSAHGASALHEQLAVPAWAGDEVLGVVALYASANAELSKRLMQVLQTAGNLLGTLFAGRRGELNMSPLTPRELEVLTLAAQGLTGRRIAERLEISPATVKTHFEHVFRKLGVSDRTAAVAQALRGGLIA
jgi:DNA-binding CsgD family transcriptional regulator